MIIITICITISRKIEIDREKISPFECGFNPLNSARLPFSVQFFLIAIIFLIFDIEIAVILPIIVTIKWINITRWIITVVLFLIVLIGGLLHEWKNGILEWTWDNS